MYVCLCKAVTDSQIKQAAEESEGCFRSVRESLGVGTICGSCACEAKKLVKASARQSVDSSLFHQAV